MNELVVESPGRINMIGEHIDYNGGTVMPAAIDKKLLIYFKINKSSSTSIESIYYRDKFLVDLNNIKKSKISWHNFILGVLDILLKKKINIKNFNCVINGDLPIGAGVSSSSALVCGLIKGLTTINNYKLKDGEMIDIAREVEYNFIGVKGGIMDQFTIINGRKNNLILLDCKSNKHKYVNAKFDPFKILLINTNVKHNLQESSYNQRVDQCNEALQHLNKKENKFKFLVDVPRDILRINKKNIDEKVFKRALFVIEEQIRVNHAYKSLVSGDLEYFGKLIYESHFGLKNLYEVSCKELDFLVDFSVNKEYVIGSRMMGGGFGGCVLNIIDKNYIDDYIREISDVYKNTFSFDLKSDIVEISDGIKIKKVG